MNGRRTKAARGRIALGATGPHDSVASFARALGVTERWLRKNAPKRMVSLLTERASRLHREQQVASRKQRDAWAKKQRERAAKRRGGAR